MPLTVQFLLLDFCRLEDSMNLLDSPAYREDAVPHSQQPEVAAIFVSIVSDKGKGQIGVLAV